MLAVSVLFAQTTLAAVNPSLECDKDRSVNELEATVDSGSVVLVNGHEYMSGHQWVSLDGYRPKIISPAEMGRTNTVQFKIRTKNQSKRTKIYKFVYKRPWEDTIVSECNVTVTIE